MASSASALAATIAIDARHLQQHRDAIERGLAEDDAEAVAADVAVVAADDLVATAAEGPVTLASQDDDADFRVVASHVEGDEKFLNRLRAECVALGGAVDRDLRDASVVARRDFVLDVGEVAV